MDLWGMFFDVLGFASMFDTSAEDLAKEQWEFTKKSQKAQYESDIATYGYNIGMAEMDIEALGKEKEYALGEFDIESEKRNRAMKEAYGASGAVVGVGTPLEEMEKQARHQEKTASMIGESYETAKTRVEKGEEFAEEQKEELESLVDELFPEHDEKARKIVNGRMYKYRNGEWVPVSTPD